jgi:hypothetical protein
MSEVPARDAVQAGESLMTNSIENPPSFLIAQTDDPELLEWLAKASQEGGGFVSSVARAGLVADPENYLLILPLLIALRAKYTKYEPSDAVKQEIRERQP